MTKRKGGSRRKTRDKFKKHFREKGKISTTNYIQELKAGDKVCLHVEPAVQKGTYHSRFVGKTGIVESSRGRCYEIKIKDGGKEKLLIVHPVHLRRI